MPFFKTRLTIIDLTLKRKTVIYVEMRECRIIRRLREEPRKMSNEPQNCANHGVHRSPKTSRI